jgi:hypothetical protein
MEETITMEQLLQNNDTSFIETQDTIKMADAEFLYKLTVIGLSSNVDQLGMEIGNAAASELARRAQLASELIKRIK